MQSIRLNLLALNNQEFEFIVYRQLYKNQRKTPKFYKKRLPKEIESNEYLFYWNTFEETNGFESFKCHSSTNPYLTLKLLEELLLENITKNLSPDEYKIEEKEINASIISLVLKEWHEGIELIDIEPYYLKEVKKFGFLVNFRFKVTSKDKSDFARRKILQLSLVLDKSFPNQTNRNYYSDKFDKIQEFVDRYKQKLFPLINNSLSINVETDLIALSPSSLKTKTYIFGNDGEKNKSQFQGLRKNGPLKDIEKKPLFIFIFEDSQKEFANSIFKALIGKTYNKTFPGMEKIFRLKLDKDDFQKIIINSYSKEDLSKVEKELIGYKSKYSERAIIGVFLEHNKFYYEKLNSQFSPYYYLKSIFTKNLVPLQAITLEKIVGYEGLKWSISNIALGIFSKLGGYPWKVSSENANCLIFGIGQAHKKIKSTKKIAKYFAYSVCLDSSGIYKKLDVLGEGDNEKSYLDNLRQNMTKIIRETVDITSTRHCIIHVPFKIKKEEIENIQESIQKISNDFHDIEFQVIKINTKNKFFGFADNISKIPYESNYIKLSKNEYLVWFEGLQYHTETVYKRFGNPVHVEFLGPKELIEEQKTSYLQDIINLSGANWRGFNAKLSPISIYYPKLIAKYISEFRNFDESFEINIENLNTPWFL